MTRALLFLFFVGMAGADERVKPSATVEVLDDKAQIDDVISRIKNARERDNAPADTRAERLPPPSPSEKDLKRTKERTPARAPHRERANHSKR